MRTICVGEKKERLRQRETLHAAGASLDDG
jgi:hypothetical protein